MKKPLNKMLEEMREELRDYSHEDRVKVFQNAIYVLFEDGEITQDEVKYCVQNLEPWLKEIFYV